MIEAKDKNNVPVAIGDLIEYSWDGHFYDTELATIRGLSESVVKPNILIDIKIIGGGGSRKVFGKNIKKLAAKGETEFPEPGAI